MSASPHKRILVICTANICRSPMAAALLRHALSAEEAPWSGIEVDSAGVAAVDGEPASPNSVTAMRKVGLDLTRHRSRALGPDDWARSDLIFGMTRSHLDALAGLGDEPGPAIALFREFAEGPDEIPDPFGGPLSEYEACRDSMVEAIPGLLRHLRERFPAP
jgi:protein-tyrosine-phosphatase